MNRKVFRMPATLPEVSATIRNEDIDRARLAWRRDAQRRYWGYFDAQRVRVVPSTS